MTARRTPKRASYDASVIHSSSLNALRFPADQVADVEHDAVVAAVIGDGEIIGCQRRPRGRR